MFNQLKALGVLKLTRFFFNTLANLSGGFSILETVLDRAGL
jgi:hypothetical protein